MLPVFKTTYIWKSEPLRWTVLYRRMLLVNDRWHHLKSYVTTYIKSVSGVCILEGQSAQHIFLKNNRFIFINIIWLWSPLLCSPYCCLGKVSLWWGQASCNIIWGKSFLGVMHRFAFPWRSTKAWSWAFLGNNVLFHIYHWSYSKILNVQLI